MAIVCTPHEGEGVAGPFFRTFIQEELRSNQDFGWGLRLQVGVVFFRWDLKTSCIKNSKFESQAKKMIPIVISTISDLWSPALTNFWQSLFVSLFSMVYTPPYPQIYIFLWGTILFFISCSQGLGRFQISWGASVLGRPNSIFGRGRIDHFLP